MMNEQERIEREAEDDGYRNEFQRAAAWSALQPKHDDRQKALGMIQDGLNVAVALTPRHCPITDAVIGNHVTILAFGDSRDALLDVINNAAAKGDSDEIFKSGRSTPGLHPVNVRPAMTSLFERLNNTAVKSP
jgi:hypothetical protein